MMEKESEREEDVETLDNIVEEKKVTKKVIKKYVVKELLEKLNEILDVNTLRLLENEVVEKIIEEEKALKTPYPDLINEPWIYIRPHKRFLDKWYDMWKNILMTYAINERKFLVDLTKLTKTFPFYNASYGKGLSLSDLQIIIERIINEKKGRWLNTDKTLAIIYWEPINNIIQKILKYSREIGLKYITIDLLDKIWSDLPINEKVKILNWIVTNSKGKWVVKNYAIKIKEGV